MNNPNHILAASIVTIPLDDNKEIEAGDVGVIDTSDEVSASIFFVRIWELVKLNKDQFTVVDINKVGDAHEYKVCNVCHKLLPTSLFQRNQNGKGNRPVRRPSCTDCRKIIDGMNMSSAEKARWEKEKPVNVPFECPICKKRTIAGVTSKIVLDHNHITGTGRAWICDSCNTGIGRFKDDEVLLQRAIEFLRSTPVQEVPVAPGRSS